MCLTLLWGKTMGLHSRYMSCLTGWLVFFILLSVQAVASTDDTAASQGSITARLQYQPDGFSHWLPINEEREVVFKKEPSFSGGDVRRGAIPVGGDESDFIGYACDVEANTLYLDLNQNLDLTDDPTGLCKGAAETYGQFMFADIQMDFEVKVTRVHAGVTVPYMLHIQLGDFYNGVSVVSGWDGTSVIDGQNYYFVVVDNLNGHLDGGDTMVLEAIDAKTTVEQMRETWPDYSPGLNYLSANGRCYGLTWAFSGTDGGGVLDVNLTEKTDGLGQLNISGQFVEGVLLSGAQTVKVEKPAASVWLPMGEYELTKAWLANEFRADFLEPPSVTIGAEPASVTVGGPLNPSCTVKRVGSTLRLDYKLVGADGQTYEPYGEDQRRAGFTAYRNGEKIASGKFAYG